MTNFLEFIGLSSHREFLMILIVLMAPYIINIGYTYWKTKDARTMPIQIVSLISINIFVLGTIYLLHRAPYFEFSDKAWIGIVIANIVNLMNLMILTTEYLKERKNRNLDEDHINRNHFSSTLNTFVILIVIGVSFSLFLDKELVSTILISTLPAGLSIWVNHLFAKRQLVDDNRY